MVALSIKVPVNVGLALVAFLSSVVCRLVPFSVIAGATTVPVKVGFAFGALSNNSVTTFVPSTTNILQAPITAKSQSTLRFAHLISSVL